jgi:hypothetical protein
MKKMKAIWQNQRFLFKSIHPLLSAPILHSENITNVSREEHKDFKTHGIFQTSNESDDFILQFLTPTVKLTTI